MPCPCGSQMKYKRCCQKYHKGAYAKDALTLMKSRYSAYVLADAPYIIKTTHPDNPQYQDSHKNWTADIMRFSRTNHFVKLEIISYEVEEPNAFVTFKAFFSNGELYEKSKFVKKGNRWLYLDGEFQE